MVSYKSLPVSYFYSFCMCATSLSVTTYNYKPKKRSAPFTFYLYRVLCMQGCETFNFQQPLNIIYMYVKSLLYLISLPLLSLPLSPLPSSSGGNFPRGTAVVNETLQFSLGDGDYACDMAVFTMWCKSFFVQFSALDISPDLFVSTCMPCTCVHVHVQNSTLYKLVPVHCHVCYFPFKCACTFSLLPVSLSPSLPPDHQSQ